MEYIVFDLEWTQCPDGKEYEIKTLPFEIIEIGAVKLDENLEVTGTFHDVIRPSVYRKIHAVTSQIVKLDVTELKSGKNFSTVLKAFFRWCGSDYVFCSWGPADLTELQRNLKYFGLSRLLKGPVTYYNVQKLFSLYFDEFHAIRSLEYAVDALELKKSVAFHRAFADAYYTASIFSRIPPEFSRKNYSVDYYCNPKSKKDELHLIYDEYKKYVSREFKDSQHVMADKEVNSMSCYICGQDAVLYIPWFSGNQRTHMCVAYCKTHGYLSGRIRIKKTDSERFFAVKVIRRISKEQVDEIFKRRDALREKRKIKKSGNEESI